MVQVKTSTRDIQDGGAWGDGGRGRPTSSLPSFALYFYVVMRFVRVLAFGYGAKQKPSPQYIINNRIHTHTWVRPSSTFQSRMLPSDAAALIMPWSLFL